jgi:hypothetical protein
MCSYLLPVSPLNHAQAENRHHLTSNRDGVELKGTWVRPAGSSSHCQEQNGSTAALVERASSFNSLILLA